MRLERNSTPLMFILSLGHTCLDIISPPGEATNKLFFIKIIGMLYHATHRVDINECEAPESNNMVTGLELIENIPIRTSRAC